MGHKGIVFWIIICIIITANYEDVMFTNRGKALTFDDILLVPGFSDITPDAVDISTWLTPEIPLRIPLLSAAMDTVTEAAMAISMARMGGIGIIHKNMPVARQRLEVEKVKKSESGMILDPVTISPNNTVQEALDLMSDFRVSGLPVVENGRLVGILTNRDVRFVQDGAAVRVSEVMTSTNLVTVPMGTSLEESKRHLHEHRIEKLLVVDEEGLLRGLITMKDIDKVQKYPNACRKPWTSCPTSACRACPWLRMAAWWAFLPTATCALCRTARQCAFLK